jgi:hypothetical protein
MRRLAFIAIVLASLGGICGPRFNPPTPDACDHPADVAADSVEIGTGDDAAFVPIHDGDVIQPIHGPQGGTMIPILLHFTGANTPACVTQSTVLWRPTADLGGPTADLGNFHEDLATSSSPLKTYAQPDGSFLTKPNYLIFSGYALPGDAITITVETGQQTNSRYIYYETAGSTN